jgi:hypothetical protein
MPSGQVFQICIAIGWPFDIFFNTIDFQINNLQMSK